MTLRDRRGRAGHSEQFDMKIEHEITIRLTERESDALVKVLGELPEKLIEGSGISAEDLLICRKIYDLLPWPA